MVGAAPWSAELTLQFQKIIPQSEVTQGYEMIETCTIMTMITDMSVNCHLLIYALTCSLRPLHPNDSAPLEA